MSPPAFSREACEVIVLTMLVIAATLLLFLCVLDIVFILMWHGHVKSDGTASVLDIVFILMRHGHVKGDETAISNQLAARILVVDDFAPWRDFVLEKLRENHNLRVIGVASDGLEAVQKAEELQPDLILLDIGLPSLNGIEVARQIRKLSPKSKILFASQESSADVVQGALGTGAQGYVLKSDAGRELLEGVNAVLRGEQFVSGRFAGRGYSVRVYDEKLLAFPTAFNPSDASEMTCHSGRA
jgi:CheY-like chemotaxis protein